MERPLSEDQETSSSFDVKRLFSVLLKNWLWFFIAIGLCVGGAYTYLRYSQPLYQVGTFIQIPQPSDGRDLLGGTPFANSGGGNGKQQNMPDINGEIFKLQSAELIGEVVDSLQLYVDINIKGKVKNKPVFIDSMPVSIKVKKSLFDATSPEYKLTLKEQYFTLQSEKSSFNGQYNQPLLVNGDTVIIQPRNPPVAVRNNVYQVSFLSRAGTKANYVSRLAVAPVPKGGMGMLQIAVRDEIPQRAKRFIDVLVNRYDFANLSFKNKALKLEMEFLNSRLSAVNSELEAQENYVRDFKSSNKINDVSTSANQLLTSLTSLDSKKKENEYKENLLKLVETSVKGNNGQEERINAIGLVDADLITLIGKYNENVITKSNILQNGAPQDPRLAPVNAKLEETKRAINNRIGSIRDELKESNNFLESQERSTASRFQVLPEKEKDYIAVNRVLNIKQSLYVFLLQKKEDKDIEYASSGGINGSRFVDWTVNRNQNPKPLMIYAAAFALGLFLPLSVILIRFMLNNKVETWQDVYKSTTLPVAGEISFEAKPKSEMVATAGNRMPIAEQFRTLRTNISYISQGTAHKVILVTSSISGEGKSFVSMNLANTIALTTKKVVLLEFDLRNPGLADKLGIESTTGIANFLVNEAKIEDIILPVSGYENLSLITAGDPLPVNPGEIILNNRMQELFGYLRQHFDFIIVDTPPIEAVSDALTLGKWADLSFFVVRHKYSLRSSLTMVNQLSEDQKLPHPALIINGVRAGHGFQNVYGYGYGVMEKNGRKKKSSANKLKIA